MPRLKVPVIMAEIFLVKSVIRMPTDGVAHDSSTVTESCLDLIQNIFLYFYPRKAKVRKQDR